MQGLRCPHYAQCFVGARLRYEPDVVQHHFVDVSRLTLRYMMKKAYKRTASTVRIDPETSSSGVPRYLYRKIAEYGLMALTSVGQARRRFYLVRTAAALGEFAGHRQPARTSPASTGAPG